MSLHPTKEAAFTAQPSFTARPFGAESVAIKHAAFEVSAEAYDEIKRRFLDRGYSHLVDAEKNCLFMQFVALTRGAPDGLKQPETAWLLENGRRGESHHYMALDENGPLLLTANVNCALRFARKEDALLFSRLLSMFQTIDPPMAWIPMQHVWE